uniref:HMG box domain-containing protein n=1 Tax=Setaria digitata TaxID=48799 RepID=A0A915PZ16_9BILA
MVKGSNDKQSGFWIYLKYFVKPKLEREFGRRLRTADLARLGGHYWTKLSTEAKEEWRAKAKEYNSSEAYQHERMLRQLENNRRRHLTREKSKSSNIMPVSRRYDEVGEYSRKYFAGVDDDFEGKRESDRREFIDHYQWKFVRKDQTIKEDFFCGSEVTIATVNVYYEDNANERMIPSEISVLKCSIKHGIYDHRHYILGFAECEELCASLKKEAQENERITGLLMNSDRMSADVRFDYAQVWDDIKAFTQIDGDGIKLLLLSKEWNVVVGSFDALFLEAKEKSFSRIETRFATLEDYFMAIYATVCGVCIDDGIKAEVAAEMSEQWPSAVFCEARSLGDTQTPLSTFLEKRTLKVDKKPLAVMCGASSTRLDNFILRAKTKPASIGPIHGENYESKSITNHNGSRYDTGRSLHNQQSVPQLDCLEVSFPSRNPHSPHVVDVKIDKLWNSADLVTDQHSLSVASAPAYQEIVSYPRRRLKPNFVKNRFVERQIPSIYQSSLSDEKFSVVENSNSGNKMLPRSEGDEVVDSNLNVSDIEMFYDISIPTSFFRGPHFLPCAPQEPMPRVPENCKKDPLLNRSNKIGHISPPLSEPLEASHTAVKYMRNLYHSQLVKGCSTYPDPSKSKQFLTTVNLDPLFPSTEKSTNYSRTLSSQRSESSKLTPCENSIIPERTPGGFSLPNVYQANFAQSKKNRSAALASSKEMESRNWKNGHRNSEM